MRLRSENKETMQAQLDVLNILGENGNDYLFLWELKTGRLHFFGDISKRYPILEDGTGQCTVDEWCNIVYEKDRATLRKAMEQVMQGKIIRYNTDYRLIDREGNRVWVNCQGKCQMDAKGTPVNMVGRVSDTVLERKVDQLTGAFNGSKLVDDMKRIMEAELPCYLLLIGIDNLKHINLRHGREYGSQILCTVVDTLEELVGAGLRVYRVNGDCFAVNLPVSEKEEVEKIYQKIRTRMADYCTVSAGVVSYHKHKNVDVNALYQYAEETLDKAKRMGKNTLAFFSQKDYEEKLSTVELQEELYHSIQDNFSGFSLRYQPQLQCGSYDLFGAEALLRYNSPSRGAIGPGEFIPVLEQTGMICPVGLWVLKNALEQCRVWRKELPQMHMSVNISYTQLSQKNIVHQVLELLEESGLPGDALTLEVTESMQLQDYAYYNRLFYQWKQAGIEISVDDFGTGYSSLAYLKNLDIDEIKIDRCFVSGIQYSAYNYRLLHNMIELARSSQIRVCCEGVETKDELAALEELGPSILQGFLFHQPLTSEVFERCYIQQSASEYQARVQQIQELHHLKWSKEQLPKNMSITSESLESIVEALDDLVYVSDPMTYELYYLNSAGRRLTGAYDYKGRKCYKVLQGKDSPCKFCTNNKLQKDQFYIWEWDNKELKRHFIVKDKLIPWHGKMARLEVAVDISEREILSQAAQEKLDFSESLLACIKILAEEKDMGQAIRQMLASVVDFYQSDRAYIFEPDETRDGYWNNTYEWCREGLLPRKEKLQGVPASDLQRWIDLLSRNDSVIIPNLEEVRETSPREWETLQAHGIRRLIVTPIYQGGHLSGFLGVNNPRHCIMDDAFVRMLTLFVAGRFSKNETEERLGELLTLHYQDVLKDTELGLWFIRIDPKSDRRELFADEVMRRVLGLEQELPPEECYQHWYSRIHDGYYQYVNLTVESMVRSGRVVQLEYPWQHPTRGEVMVRCIGIRGADTDGMICLEGYHRIISDMDRPQFLPDTPTGEVFEFNERKGTIYFHTGRTLLAGDAKHERRFPRCWLENEMVHPHFVKRFTALFQNVRDSEDVDGEEILLRSPKGTYDWFRMRIRHLGTDVKDRDTILVLLDAADQERVLQLENMRIRDFYHASLGETIAYAEVDLESGQVRDAGGLWAGHQTEEGENQDSLLKFMRSQVEKNVRPDQKMTLLWKITSWAELLSQDQPIQRFRYQRMIQGKWHWVELVAHSFREQFTENIYALLYLKDIDAQVRKEHAQQEAASRDPLTGIYNRNAFEQLVLEYMEGSSDEKKGVLILLDIDNFKMINDQQGHQEGDAALCYVTKLLQETFRQGDVLGRLGGDEFMVFLKGAISREILDQRMERFYSTLRAYSKFPITCSAGITYVNSREFSYQKSIFRADMALYRSKQEGKCHYTYAEDSHEQASDKT